MARPKTKADEVYNIRRRLKRQAAREAKNGNLARADELLARAKATYARKSPDGKGRASVNNSREGISAAIKELRKINFDSAIKKRISDVEKSRQRLSGEESDFGYSPVDMTDSAVSWDFEAASTSQKFRRDDEGNVIRVESTNRKLTDAEIGAFYADNRSLFEKKKYSERDEYIKNYYGTKTVEEAMLQWLEDKENTLVSDDDSFALADSYDYDLLMSTSKAHRSDRF